MASEKVAVGLVRVACEAAAQYGLSEEELLEAMALAPDDLSDPSGVVDIEALEDLLRFVLQRTSDAAFGMRCSEVLDLRTQGFWGYALMSSMTLRQRIGLHLRYQKLRTASWCDVSFWVDGDSAVIDIVPRSVPADVLPILFDWGLAGACRQLRMRTPAHALPLHVWLSQPERPHHAELRALARGEVVFAAPYSQIRFAASELDRPLAGDPHLGQLATAQLDAQLADAGQSLQPQVLDDVRHRLRRRLHGDASLERVARDLRVSARTLQRQLSALGASFQQLLEEARRTHAITYLLETNDAIEQVAARVGYGDASNFRRAFRRWTGYAPLQYRARERAARSVGGQ